MREPVILINYTTDNGISIPITSKPLPALLAPPLHNGSFSTIVSSPASSHHLTPIERSNSSNSIEEQQKYIKLPPQPNYYTVIHRQSQEIQDLRQDLIKLNQKYIDQINRVQIAEKAKFQVESELEELSVRLFEQANDMVAKEKKARFHAEKKATQLERELKQVYEELDDERSQLLELKQKITSTPSLIENNESEYFDTSPSFVMPVENLQLDNGWLSLFQDFIAAAPETPLESMYRLPFMKQCLELDIEPCLRFGNSFKSNRLLTRRVLDAVIREPCFIETELPGKRHSHDDRLLSPVKQRAAVMAPTRRSSFAIFRAKSTTADECCYGCGNTIHADRFRFKLKTSDLEWFIIDRSCRDRLVAVCNFYAFIRHVRQGLQSQRTLHSLFQECVWLRLAMFWARSGVHHELKK